MLLHDTVIQYLPKKRIIVIIFDMCIETLFVINTFKGIWMRMKFDKIFWGEVKIDTLKGGGRCKQKGND